MRTVELALKLVDEVLAGNDEESRDLWNILTALRGPDRDGEGKYSSTIPIRRRAFPLTTARRDNSTGAVFDGGHGAFLDGVDEKEDWHFHSHLAAADASLRSLGR